MTDDATLARDVCRRNPFIIQRVESDPFALIYFPAWSVYLPKETEKNA